MLCVYLDFHDSGLGYGGYDFGGGLGGHSSSGENSLESSIGNTGGFGDFKNHHYVLPHHHMEHGKHPNHKSVALKGLLVPLAGVALLGKITRQCLATQLSTFYDNLNTHHLHTLNLYSLLLYIYWG